MPLRRMRWTGDEQDTGGGTVGKYSGPILSRFWTKVHRDNVWRHLLLSVPFPDYLCRVSFRKYSTLSPEVVEKDEQICKGY